MLSKLLALLFPIRLGDLTVPAHEHEWGFDMGPNYALWYCAARGCHTTYMGFDVPGPRT